MDQKWIYSNIHTVGSQFWWHLFILRNNKILPCYFKDLQLVIRERDLRTYQWWIHLYTITLSRSYVKFCLVASHITPPNFGWNMKSCYRFTFCSLPPRVRLNTRAFFFSCQFAKSYLCRSINLGHYLLDNVQALKQERNIFSFMEQPKSYYQDRGDHIFEGWLYPSHYRWPMLNYLPLQQPSVSTFYSDELVKASGSLSSPWNQMRGSKKIRILPWSSGWS